MHVRQLERVGDGAISDAAVVHIEAVAQLRVVIERPPPAFVGKGALDMLQNPDGLRILDQDGNKVFFWTQGS